MTYINNTTMLIEEEVTSNLSNKHNSKIQDKQIWNSLRTHILSRREKNKQAEVDAEVLRKKKRVEYQKIQENKLSLAQINGRLSQLKDKRDELEEEKRVLLNQMQTTEDTSQSTALITPKTESNCELLDIKPIITNNVNNASIPNHRTGSLHPQQPQNMFRTQITANAQPGLGSPASANKLSPLSQRSLMVHNSNSINTGSSNPTLLVCSPAAINIAASNQNNNVTCPSSLAASLSSNMPFPKYSPLYSNNAAHMLTPNVGTSNKLGRTPSPQSQTYQQQQIVVPFPSSINKYPSVNSGSSINNVNSAASTPIVNSINHPLTTVTNNSFSIENSNRRSGREDSSQPFNRNIWINNNCNTSNKNSLPNVSNYGSFYQPSTTAVNYCVNNGMSSSPSLSSVNTVYSYSGPTPHPRTESSGNLMVSDHAALQIPKPVSSHQHHFNPGHSHPPLYMSPGIRNQTSNHAYHSKPPSHSGYSEDKLVSTTPNFYQSLGIRNIHPPNTTAVSSQPHQMGQKSHNIGYSIRHPVPPPVSQLSQAATQPSHTSSYTVPSCSVSGSSNKPSVSVSSMADAPRYQQPSTQTPISRHD